MDDDSLRKQALQWVRDNKTRLLEEVIVESNFNPETDEYPPAASFMAGTPGAGKTEVSKRFLDKFTATPIRIDADDFRQRYLAIMDQIRTLSSQLLLWRSIRYSRKYLRRNTPLCWMEHLPSEKQ
jgi:signal recognition particle GTPase